MDVTEAYLRQYWQLPGMIRWVGLLALSMSPIACLTVLGETASPNKGVLEGAIVYFVLSILLTSAIVSTLAKRVISPSLTYAICVISTAALILYLNQTYEHPLAVSVLFGMVFAAYMVRVHFAYLSKQTVAEYFQSQLKTDSLALVAIALYYVITGIFTLHHLHIIRTELITAAIACMLLWSCTLWQLERLELGLRAQPFVMWTGVVGSIAFIIGMTMIGWTQMMQTGVKPGHYPAPPLLPMELRRQKQIDNIYKHIHHPMHGNSPYYLTHHAANRLIAALFIAAAIATIALLWIYRKHRTKDEEQPKNGPVTVSQRIRLRDQPQKEDRFLTTADPVRVHVQAWLRNLRKRGIDIHKSQTIRTAATQHPDSRIDALLEKYEQIRYDSD